MTTRPWRPLRSVCALLAIALAAACGGEDGARSERERTPEALPGAAPSPPQELPDLPAAGTARVELIDGRVTLVSNAAPRVEVLEELALRAAFDLRMGEVEDRPVTLRAEGVSVPEAIAALCEGVSYALGYRADAARGGHALVWLQAGLPARIARLEKTKARRAERESRGAEGRAAAKAGWARWLRAERPDREERLRAARARAEAAERAQAEHIERLESTDPDERVEALAEIHLEGAGLEWVADLAASDRDPAVRRQAVLRLGEEDGFAAVNGLVEALEDPAPEVVIEALRGLEQTGDPSLLPRIRPLEQHPDPRVREVAAEVVEMLE